MAPDKEPAQVAQMYVYLHDDNALREHIVARHGYRMVYVDKLAAKTIEREHQALHDDVTAAYLNHNHSKEVR